MKLYSSENANNMFALNGFQPVTGATYSGATTVSVVYAAKLGADVSISINGAAVSYDAGDIIILSPGTTYTFATSTPVHLMYI